MLLLLNVVQLIQYLLFCSSFHLFYNDVRYPQNRECIPFIFRRSSFKFKKNFGITLGLKSEKYKNIETQ